MCQEHVLKLVPPDSESLLLGCPLLPPIMNTNHVWKCLRGRRKYRRKQILWAAVANQEGCTSLGSGRIKGLRTVRGNPDHGISSKEEEVRNARNMERSLGRPYGQSQG